MIELKNVSKIYNKAEVEVPALDNVSFTINKGDIFGVIGLSGAGKSTLVRCINFLEKPTSGEIIFDGVNLESLSNKELLEKRREMSMIFQSFNLLSQRTVISNVCYPLEIAKVPKSKAKKKALELLKLVGIEDKAKAYPAQLSGGQKQRVAIARALATEPRVLLCDEATSALDPKTTDSILELLKDINKNLGVTVVIITHEMRIVEKICNRVAVVEKGKVVEIGDVHEVFLAPKSDMARNLIMPTPKGNYKEVTGKKLIRLVFDGQSSSLPVISNLSLECRTAVNILAADTKNLDGKAYGQMLLQLPDSKTDCERIYKFLQSNNITFKEVDE